MNRKRQLKLTINAITVWENGSKARASELVPSGQATGAEFPLLRASEKRVSEERMRALL